MNRICTVAIEFFHSIDGVADYVHQTSFDLFAYRHCDRTSRRKYLHPALQAVGTIHGNRTYGIFTNVLLNFYNQLFAVVPFYL